MTKGKTADEVIHRPVLGSPKRPTAAPLSRRLNEAKYAQVQGGIRLKRIAIVGITALALALTGCASDTSAGGNEPYLSAVCPSELALADYMTALDAQDLAQATDYAVVLIGAVEKTISLLANTDTAWGEGIEAADIATLHDAYVHDLEKMQTIAAPGTMGDKPFLFDYPGSDAATWRIHETLELPKTLAEACSTRES